MRKLGLIISAICVFLTQQASAQVNPQTGYVITNNGDTIHGTIDYLTDAKNARTCLFRKNGESEFVAYTPDDIRAYRLANDGIYYVSRMFEADGKSTPLFAEFLIQGGVSLYRYNVDGCNYYQFVGNDGKTAMLKDDGLTADDTNYREKLQERRGRLQDVMQILYKSPNLLKRLWKADLSPENVANIIKQYDEEFCTEEGECIKFRYDSKKAATVGYRLFAGVGIGYAEYGYSILGLNNWFRGVSPKVTAGIELIPLRTKQQWLFSLALGYSRCNLKSKTSNPKNKEKAKLKMNYFDVDLGVTYYALPKSSKVRPFLRGGTSGMLQSGIKMENLLSIDVYTDADAEAIARYQDSRESNKLGIGWFLGTGVETVHFRIGVDYKQQITNEPESRRLFSATIAYLF